MRKSVCRHLPEEPPAKESKGYTKIANKYVDLMPDMGASAWAVFCQLARHSDIKGHAYPSIRYLAELTRLDKQTVVESIKRLVRLRLVQTNKRKGKVTYYYVTHRE